MEARSVIERPILFSAPMVRAILDGRKTVTRRLVKPQPTWGSHGENGDSSLFCASWKGRLLGVDGAREWFMTQCPYGQPGDHLGVREPWRVPASLDDLSGKQIAEKCLDAGYRKPWCPTQYEADGARTSQREWHEFGSKLGESTPGRYRHARFMPRWASRLTLEVTGVRVERLQEISEADCFAEGLQCMEQRDEDGRRTGRLCALNEWLGTDPSAWDEPRNAFRDLWSSLNGTSSWDANPWLWVVSFRRIEQEARAA